MRMAHVSFAVLSGVVIAVFHAPLHTLLRLSLNDSRYSHIAVMPLVSACLIYAGRKRIFASCHRCLRVGVPIVILGAVIYSMAAARGGVLWLLVLAIVAMWVAAFVSCYGTAASRAAIFALALLLFAIPIPAQPLDGINTVLQRGSAEVTHVLLKAAGVPVLRDDLRFSLPGLEIEVAEECSGVRSAFALVITGLLAGQILLRTAWARICLGLLTIPIAIFKNGVRIATISWLTSYVDEGIIHSDLHQRGGLPFSLLALAMVLVAVLVLRRAERTREAVIARRATAGAAA